MAKDRRTDAADHFVADPGLLSAVERDALATGLIGLDAAGVVTVYNQAEAAMTGRSPHQVIGRNFFRDVAPCTDLPGFHGRFLEGVRRGRMDERFEFTFGFEPQPMRVRVRLHGGGSPGRYWIQTEALGHVATSLQRYAAQAVDAVDRRARAEPIDAAVCEREPIHVGGAIQPYAVMLVVQPTTLNIQSCSENIADVAPGHQPSTLLGQPIGDLLPPHVTDRLVAALGTDGLADPTQPLRLTERIGQPSEYAPAPLFSMVAHQHDGRLIIEFERVAEHPEDFGGATAVQAQDAIRRLRGAATLHDSAAVIVNEIRVMTGFERVLVYRFDPDWNGEALAEAKSGDWPQSLLGLRFPASDIPAQARALYTRSPSRFVVDRDAVSSAVLTESVVSNRPVDMTYAQARALSPVHLEYQRNLGVNGSMSISIMVDGRLWGLVIGHHRRPHYVTPDTRALAGLVTDAFALRLTELQRGALWQEQQAALAAQTRLLERMAGSDDFVEALTSGEAGPFGTSTLLDLFEATGAAVLSGERVATVGQTPKHAALRRVSEWLRATVPPGVRVFATDRLGELFDAGESSRKLGSGLLAAFVAGEAVRDHLLLWFRPEQTLTIAWGGDPNKSVLASNATRTVLPRRSFERWVEERRGYAEPWAPWQHGIAEALAVAIEGVILRQGRRITSLTAQGEALQLALEQKDVMAREIDHRVKNSLQIVAGVMRMQARNVSDPTAKAAFEDTFARVMSVARVHDSLHKSDSMEDVDMGETLRLLCADLTVGITGAEQRLSVETDPGLIVPSRTAVALSMIATELVTNALKYAYEPGTPGEVAVLAKVAPDNVLTMQVRDHGRGLPPGWTAQPESNERGSGLGMRVIRAMLQQVGAEMMVEDAGPGVCFTVLV